MLLAQQYAPDLTKLKDYFIQTPLGYIVRGDMGGAVNKLGSDAKLRVDAMINPETAIETGMDYVTGGAGTIGKSAFKSAYNTPTIKTKVKDIGFDRRFDPRANEQDKLKNLTKEVESYGIQENVPTVSLLDYEGKPFVTSMSDRTGTQGVITNINGIKLNKPVYEIGGQGHMFLNPEQVWASGEQPVKDIMKNAYNLRLDSKGQNPLYLPWQMAPTGGDFSNMTGEIMLSYADTVMTQTNKKLLDKEIKKIIPDWKGVSSDDAFSQYNKSSAKQRFEIQNMMDKNFRDKGGLGIGEARLAVSDPQQYLGKDGSLINVGQIDPTKDIIQESGHAIYPKGIPGHGIGKLDRDINVFELLPETAKARGLLDLKNPRTTDLRALQMKSYGGLITEDILKRLGY